MSRTKINVSAVIDASGQINSAKTYVSSAKSTFTGAKNGIDGKIKSRYNINNRLVSVQKQLSDIDGKISKIRATVQSGANLYRETDDRVKSWRKDLNVGMNVNGAVISKWALYFKNNDADNSNDIFGSDSFKVYADKNKTEHSEEYFKSKEYSKTSSFKSDGEFDDISEDAEKWKENKKKKLEDKGLYREEKETKYYNKDGNEISKENAPNFYERQATLGEWSVENKISVSYYEGTFDTMLGGVAAVTVGEAEMHAEFSAGCYIIGSDGKQVFSPGVNAEVGGSATAFNVTYENQLFGDEMLGMNVDGSVTALSVSTEVELNVNFMGKDEKGNVVFDPQVNVGVDAEVVLVEVEGSVGVNILGGEASVSGSVKVGFGANADVGYKDGVFKCEIGASLGIGFDVGFEVDVGGMVNTAADVASSAWDGLKNGWNSLWG